MTPDNFYLSPHSANVSQGIRPLKLRLQALREARGLTRSELAGKLGCNVMTIVRLESGGARPNQDTLGRLAKALDVELAELLAEGETAPGNKV